jgi:hypothetical protein
MNIQESFISKDRQNLIMKNQHVFNQLWIFLFNLL